MSLPVLNHTYGLIWAILAVSSLSSCVNTKEVTYFNKSQQTEFHSSMENMEPVLRKNDILSISVSSLNSEATQMFNTGNSSANTSANGGGAVPVSGYLIDQEGYIKFPALGKIKAAGKTKAALSEEIAGELVSRKLLLEPIIDIRYLNYKISVLGEVENPSVFTVPSENITLLEALGLAGDLTIYAKRDNVLLIREENGVKKLTRIDLTTADLFTSPYYYLKSNDVIYVEPSKSKVASTSRVSQWLPIVMSTLSLAVIALDRFL